MFLFGGMLMKILIIDGVGLIGETIARKLLENVELKFFSKDPMNLEIHGENVERINGDVQNVEQLMVAMADIDRVLVIPSNDDLPQVMQGLIETMSERNVQKVVFIVPTEVYDENPAQIEIEGDLKDDLLLRNIREATDEIENSGINYTIIQPDWFDNPQDRYRIAQKKPAANGYDTDLQKKCVDLAIRALISEDYAARESLKV